MIGIDYLVDTVSQLSAKVDASPTLQWATVTGTNPVRVRMDGMEEPLAGGVESLADVRVGDRVLTVLWNRRAIVLGSRK